jgi:hypothetical protein
MKIGLIIIVVSIIWYIVHGIIYNHYLQKTNPEIFNEAERQRVGKQKIKEVRVVMTSGETPAWVMLLGMPPIPLFLLGILITIIGLIISFFK